MESNGSKQPSRIMSWAKLHWLTLRSWLLFAATLGVWLIWYPVIVRSGVLNGLLLFNAEVTGGVLRLLGAPVQVDGTLVGSAAFTMRVGHECTAVVPAVILLCAVVAYPSRLTQKILCVAAGIPLLFILNFLRLITLYYIGAYIPGFFDMAHFVVWQSVMVLAVVAIWLFWVGKVANVRAA